MMYYNDVLTCCVKPMLTSPSLPMQHLILINTPPPLSRQPYDCDTITDSSVSEIIISKANLKSAINNVLTTGTTGGISFINSIGLAYDNFRDKNGNVVSGFGGKAFKWFCSGQVHEADTFGSGYGFVDRMYIFGEEADASAGYGRFFAIANKTMHMITGEGSGDATSIQGGRNGIEPDALENVAMVHTGEKDHVALMFSPDYGEKKLRMYIGKKGKRYVDVSLILMCFCMRERQMLSNIAIASMRQHFVSGFKTDGTSCGACTADKDFLARNGLGTLVMMIILSSNSQTTLCSCSAFARRLATSLWIVVLSSSKSPNRRWNSYWILWHQQRKCSNWNET
jgi:hypothetical protein